MMFVPSSVLITGANRGIGLGLVKQWCALPEVKHVFACARKPDDATELNEMSKTDSRIHCLKLDVNCDKSIIDAQKRVCTTLGEGIGLNLLVNNAGILLEDGSHFRGADRSVYLQHFDTNVVSVVKVIEAFLPLLKIAAENSLSEEWGAHRAAVVNISSGLGSIGANTTGSRDIKNIPYRLSKAALNQLTKTLAVDFEEYGILVVSMCPGWVKTDMGGPKALIEVEQSTRKQVETVLSLRRGHSGSFIKYTGEDYPF